MKTSYHIKAFLAGLLLSSSVVPVATAEDIEIYNSLGVAASSSNPNIMFIVDTSGSMSAETKVKEPYDASTAYAGSCESDGIYFVSDGKLPDCATSTDYFNRAALVCDHAVVGYDVFGDKISPPQDGSLLMIGTYSDQLAQYDLIKKKWVLLDTIGTDAERDYMVECFSDSGIHGVGNGAAKYIKDGGTGFTSTVPTDPKIPHLVWSGGAGNLQLFDGNYINYLNDASVPLVDKSRMEQVKSAVEIMVRGNTRVDIGLMQFDQNTWIKGKSNTEGGPVVYPILDVGADRNDFFSRLKNLQPISWTPLSEVYYEALLYYGGKAADYSLSSKPSNQVVSSTMMPGGKLFRSPISSTCDKNYIVFLTDGEPTTDDLSEARKGVLPGFDKTSCSTNITNDVWDDNRDAFNSDDSQIDNCLDELAGWAATKDVADDSLGAALEGEQHIVTHTIGFQLGNAAAVQLLKDTAKKGKGLFKEANSEKELIDIFNLLIASALQVNSTFSSPAVSVNAFNRSTHLDDLYFTLFKPGDGNRWDGNLKKYKLEFEVDKADRDKDGDVTERLPFIADATSTAALPVHAVDDKTGFFSDTATSFWTKNGPDGKEVTLGGAASELTASRKVYTTTGAYTSANGVDVPTTKALTSSANEVATSNASLTEALLGVTGFPDIVSGTPYRETVINWAAGRDAMSQFGVANTFNDARTQMGDPLHAEPALVQYGGTLTDPDLVAYVATNDGYLHAINTKNGVEYFSFIPQELLPELSTEMEDLGGAKTYGLDGSVVAWIEDDSGVKGVIDGSDRVILYVSMRRGGRNIYALDVTDR
ncbi:MAG: PilC/PilY family type IV pilus protein, partial [Gammaproteobacteria bacterium]|nr:PilC/PilY family type IV pilus protein [Gammaproteobacteria bacterium]